MRNWIVITLMLLSVRCLAFSVGPGFLWPSNYELVKLTGDIMLVRAAAMEGKEAHGPITFDVLEVLKGDYTEKQFREHGYIGNYGGASPTGDFSRARPGTYAGMGQADDYKIGAAYLLFLRRMPDEPEKLTICSYPLSRTQEEVTGPGDPWVTAVRHYLNIAALGDYAKEKAALKNLRAQTAAGRDPDRFPPGLVVDIDRHFATPFPLKSYEDLLAMYGQGDEHARRQVLYAMIAGKHAQALPLVKPLLEGGAIPLTAAAGLLKAANDPPTTDWAVEKLAEEYLKATYIDKPRESLLLLAEGRHLPTMLRVLREVKPREAVHFADYFRQYAPDTALAIYREKINGDYLKELLVTYLLAELGDADVVTWALRGIDERPNDRIYSISRHILALSPREEADAAVQRLAAGPDPAVAVSLFSSLCQPRSGNPHRLDLLRRIAARKDLTKAQREECSLLLNWLPEEQRGDIRRLLEKPD